MNVTCWLALSREPILLHCDSEGLALQVRPRTKLRALRIRTSVGCPFLSWALDCVCTSSTDAPAPGTAAAGHASNYFPTR